MRLVPLRMFCRKVASEYRADVQRVYGSLYAAYLGDKIKGERRHGRIYIDTVSASKWVEKRSWAHRTRTTPEPAPLVSLPKGYILPPLEREYVKHLPSGKMARLVIPTHLSEEDMDALRQWMDFDFWQPKPDPFEQLFVQRAGRLADGE